MLLTVSIVAELVGLDAASRCLASLRRNHPAPFPLLPEPTNRLRGTIAARLWRVLAAEGNALCASASVPVPIASSHRARHEHRWHGEADYGRVASKKRMISGCERHLLISASGLVPDFALAAANEADGTLAKQVLIDKSGLTALGDKGSTDGPLHQRLAARDGLTVLTPQRRNQRAQLSAALTRAINQAHQIILQRNRAKSVWDLAPRVHAKCAAL